MPSFMTGDRIVGGEDAAAPIPWQVSVRNGQSGWGHFCGGTILDATTVMSAAHCFTTGQSMSGYYITAGVTNRHDSGQTIEIANGVWNAEMPYQGNNNDFMILLQILQVKPVLSVDGEPLIQVHRACQTTFNGLLFQLLPMRNVTKPMVESLAP